MDGVTKKKFQYLEARFGDTPTFTFTMKVKDLMSIYYVAVRGIDKVDGAVQRVLNKRRISDIKEFILGGHTFFNSFILNWTDENYAPTFNDGLIELPIMNSSAQVIDGQHRIAGFEAAMEDDESVGERDIIITLCMNLSTQKAAEIFLNINTEQKPVPKSLMYDLFGEVIDDESHAVNRSTDIARHLNDDPESPLYKLIKFPGSPRGVGSIELSTFVSSIKEHLKPGGTFGVYKLTTLDHQRVVITNFFKSVKSFYSEQKLWTSKTKNPFLKAAGFNGAIDFLTGSLIQRCAEKGSFSVDTMNKVISFESEDILTWDDLKGLDGKTSRKKVKDALEANLLKSLPAQDQYEF
ncbi:DGQHR domain-containing protein [Thiomicrorhabdus sp. 6S2-11]|uniref:DGQHR domain-containing protein n=1 Tax=Thiomicrorhabdus marina TaxID=2818442 RepID=A0ABS3Q4D5_9GAMM|nr:DGQHR domain-containing protein [Thiomicrorhabdus marina]MBO1927197.1 DGQHR domain-containing protein [Thiomicrorhabdus marina]